MKPNCLSALLACLLAGLWPVAPAGAAPGAKPDPRQPVRVLGKALDRAQRHVDEYGTLHVSAPVLTYARSNEFRFRLDRGASNYFDEAKSGTQGRAAAYEQQLQIFGLDLKASADPTQLGAYGAALANYRQQFQAFGAQQDARRTAADLMLKAGLAEAATKTDPVESNRVAAAAWTNYANQVYSSATPPTYPTAGSNGLPSVSNSLPIGLTESNLAKLTALQPFMSLLSNSPTGLTVPNRSALITAAGDHTVEKLFERITGWDQPGDAYRKLFGMTTVAVEPGWRTRKGWAGEVVVYADLHFRPARQETVRRLIEYSSWPTNILRDIAIENGYETASALRDEGVALDRIQRLHLPETGDEPKPGRMDRTYVEGLAPRFALKTRFKPVQVTVISPLTEVETYDLASSYRRQSEFALSLAFALRYAGAEGEAKAFEKFARSLQHDIATRTTLAAVNALSGQEGVFGFQIGPRIRALADPAERESEAGTILDRQSFPALVLVSVGKGDTEPRLAWDTNSCRVRVYEPYLELRQIRRWVPLERSFFSGRDWYRPGDWFHPRLDESDRVSATDLLEGARKSWSELGWTGGPRVGWTNQPGRALLQRLEFLEQQLVGSVNQITLPEDFVIAEADRPRKTASVTFDAVPAGSVIRLERGTNGLPLAVTRRLTFTGNQFEALDLQSITSLSSNATVRTAAIESGRLVVAAEVRAPDHLAFGLRTDSLRYQPASVITPAVEVVLTPSEARKPLPKVELAEPRSVALSRDRADTNRFEPKRVRLMLVGPELGRIDGGGIRVVSGQATLADQPKVYRDALMCPLIVSAPGESIALELPLKDQPGDAILSLPIEVRGE